MNKIYNDVWNIGNIKYIQIKQKIHPFGKQIS